MNTASVDAARVELMPAEQACTPGSRLGQVVTETAIFRFICRRAADGAAYDDLGVIGHNPKTGATCFWTARNGRLPTSAASSSLTLTARPNGYG